MTNELLSLIIFSNFGCFRKPDQNADFFLTFDYIPKPAILGILGAIIGLNGYSIVNQIADFYEKLKGLKIGLQPLKKLNQFPINSKDFSVQQSEFQKMIVKSSNLHGYGSNEGNGNWLISEQILLNPAYRIFIQKGECELNLYQTLKNNLKEKKAAFSPYMGKNEFPISIIYEGNVECLMYTEISNMVPLDTIVCSNAISHYDINLDIQKGKNGLTIINYPIGFINYQYRYEKIIFGDLLAAFKSDFSSLGYSLVRQKQDGNYVFLF